MPQTLDTADARTSLPASRPLRVMFVITSMHVGGAETLLLQLIRRLDRARFAPQLCCLKERGELGDVLASEIPVHANFLRHKFEVGVLGRLTRLFREQQIDAVITVGAGDKMFWGRWAARRAGVPVILSALHSTGWPDSINWLNRRLHRWNDGFIAVARSHAEYLVAHERLPASRVYVIPNGVDTEKFSPARSPASVLPAADSTGESNVPTTSVQTPLVGIVAQLRPEKNHELFLRMAQLVRRQVPDAHFLIVGDGPCRTDLKRLAMELDLSSCVHFMGQRSDIPELLRQLDVFVLTSHVEANPVSILEAMATGKPVVATRVGSIPDSVINGQTGYVVDPGDAEALARRVSELLLDAELRQQFGDAARQRVVQHASVDRMVRDYETLIELVALQKSVAKAV